MKRPDYNISKSEIIGAEIPKETLTYKPIYHSNLIDLTLSSIEKAGFKLDRESYTAQKNGMLANGNYTISNVNDSEMQLQIGWQNSYDKSATLKFAIGTRIFICSNGSVHGSFGAFKKKHMGNVQIFTPQTIVDYIKSAGDVFLLMQKDREAMKQIEVNKSLSAELIGKMLVEEELISTLQTNIIMREMKKPSFEYNSPGSLWELYNHTTHALKECRPSEWIDTHARVNSLFVDTVTRLNVQTATHTTTQPPVAKQLSIFSDLNDELGKV